MTAEVPNCDSSNSYCLVQLVFGLLFVCVPSQQHILDLPQPDPGAIDLQELQESGRQCRAENPWGSTSLAETLLR